MALKDLKLNDETSGDLGGYFHVTITDLDLATQYPLEFQYIYSDKRQNDNWSAVKYFTTLGATVPNDPQLQSTDVVGGAGFIKVSWSGNDASGNAISNFDRVDVHISGTTFGDGAKPAGSFKSSGTQSFTCVAGIYIVQLKVYSLNGASSFFSTARTVTVTEVTEEIQTPVVPTGFTSSRILGGIEVAWAGTYGSAWTGFEAINIYAGTSSSATGGTYIKVGQMTANKISNKIVVPVDGTYVRYGVPVYIHASSVNKNGIESAISANVTSQSSGARSAIGTDLADEIISNAKLVNDAVTAAKIATSAITETKIADDAITTPKLVANAITADKIVSSAITADKIATNAVTAGKILAGSIDVLKLAAGTISVNNLESGTLSATSFIRAGTAGSSRIEISSAAVPASSILAGLYIYNGSTAVLQAPLGGGLTITGALTATSISTSSGNFSVNSSGVMTAKSANIDGTIKATSGYIGGETSGIYIAAGAIQNDVGGSQFKLDSSGKARFGSATGNAIVINPTASNGGYYLYHTSGGQDGSASSAFSISTSGILTATGANFSGTITNSTSSDYWNSNGTFRFGGSNGITYNGTTISMGSIVSMPAAQITGTITANAIVSNATITSPTIAGGIFRTASSGQRIVINETANQIDIYPDSSSSPGYISASTVLSYGSLKLASPYASGFSQSNIQLYSLGSSLAYIQLTANVTSLTGGLTVSAGSLFSGDADFSSNIIATGAINAATLTPSPNTYITTSGQIRRTSGSSIRFKKDVVDLLSVVELDPKKLYNLPVRAFKYKNEFVSDEDSRHNKLIPGFIAEEVEEVYPIAADYDLNGVEKWNANVMVPAMLALIQDLNTRLDALEA